MSSISVLNTDAGLSGKTLLNAEDTQTITGAKTFSRSPNPPFVVTAASANVQNLDADKLDGQDGSYYQSAANLNAGIIPVLRLGLQNMCDGRLTLTTGTPVTTADVTGAGTIYFAPYKGNLVALYDGSATWKLYNFTEKSLALTLTSGKPYDVFIYDNSGTPTLETLVWTNDTTRATALTTQDGVYVKSGATTRRYLGTLYATGANTTEDSVTKRYVWNYYNRAARHLLRLEPTASWTYTNTVIRQVNGSASNQVDVVVGVAEVMIRLTVTGMIDNASATQATIGIGEDSTTTISAFQVGGAGNTTGLASAYTPLNASLTKPPAVGHHFYAWLESSGSGGTSTFYGTPGAPSAIGTVNGIGGLIEG